MILGASLKFSVITVCFNSESTISSTIDSVNKQVYCDVEHIFIDGGSADNTVTIIKNKSLRNPYIISGPDNGIYDAMNKGVAMARGDVICFLNSDDVFSTDDVISHVSSIFSNRAIDFVYGNIAMCSENGEVIRNWIPVNFKGPSIFYNQIPHPSLFVKTKILKDLDPPFDSTYKIAADLKQQLILAKFNSNGFYSPKCFVQMSLGGASTKDIRSYILGWFESRRAYNEVFGTLGFFFATYKIISKLHSLRVLNVFRSILKPKG